MKKVIGILLIIIGIITSLFFKNYNGNFLPYPTLWLIFAILLTIYGLFLFLKKTHIKIHKSIDSEIYKLKKEGHKIHVDFNKCKIISNNYYKEVPRSSDYRAQALDTLFDNKNAVKNVAVLKSRIVFKDSINNYEYFSPLIFKDKITISFILDKYKSTTLYVDKNNYKHYYFDLFFFNN